MGARLTEKRLQEIANVAGADEPMSAESEGVEICADDTEILELVRGYRHYIEKFSDEEEFPYETIRVERYAFSLNKRVKLGKPREFVMSDSPSTGFRPQRFMANASEPGMFIMDDFSINGEKQFVGDGGIDLYTFNPSIIGTELALPILGPLSKLEIKVRYTGKWPAGSKRWWQFWKRPNPFLFACTLMGPASIAEETERRKKNRDDPNQ